MPLPYLLLHLLLTTACVASALSLPERSRTGRVLGALLLAAVAGGLALERRSDWAWTAMLLAWPGTVFITNLALEGVAVLVAVMWRQSRDRKARLRAALLSIPAVGVALWSYAWQCYIREARGCGAGTAADCAAHGCD